MAPVRWGVLGTGSIARTVVAANPGRFVAVASRDDAIAQAVTYEALVRSATTGTPVDV